MKNSVKAMSLAVLVSFIGTQFIAIQSVSAQQYNVLPPIVDQGQQLTTPDFANLPKINIPQQTINYPLKGQVSTVPAGASFEAIVNSTVGTSVNQIGDIFTATLTKPVVIGGNTVIPEGSEAIGQVTYIDNAGRIGKNAVMDVRFTSIKLPNGQKVPVTGKIVTVDNTGTLKGGSIKKQIATGVGTELVATAGGTLAGLSIGGIAGGVGVGTVVGTAAGGFLGLGYVFARKGKEVILPSGTKVNVVFEHPVSVGR